VNSSFPEKKQGFEDKLKELLPVFTENARSTLRNLDPSVIL